jgi:hypothetical protein
MDALDTSCISRMKVLQCWYEEEETISLRLHHYHDQHGPNETLLVVLVQLLVVL